ncbi:MAG: pantoate--beta-alanine ligase [Bacteroidetes bacterium]|nr:pantoate--beta-alanine ligase [Bacteroidota bacterium]
MKQITTIKEAKQWLKSYQKKSLKIGFVPTMGALHEGHLRLISQSRAENDITICSIFVNPIQFNNPEDLAKYPRNVAQDARLLKNSGCDMLFSPTVEEMYPGDKQENLEMDFGMLDKVMEGKFRPGHFKGVVIVVRKLFNIIAPTHAYFGKKDYQQLMVIRRMNELLGHKVKIVACETVREDDGLAMSSRNLRLTIGERQVARRIFEVLCKVREKGTKTPVWELREWAIKKIQEDSSFRVEYFEIADRETLMPVESWGHKNQVVALTAVFLGDVRLIDNVELFS